MDFPALIGTSHRRLATTLAAGLSLLLLGCSSDGGGASTATSSGSGGSDSGEVSDSSGAPPVEGLRPFRDEWRTVIDQPFSTFDAGGAVAISSLSVGGPERSDNFANRGDVIVRYADVDTITVEVRRFTMTDNQDLAQQDFDKLEIWAYATDSSPQKPADMNPADNCADPNNALPWVDGCQIRIYYNNLTQPSRSGADLRVTLPRDFIYDLNVATGDNDHDADYQNRGHVCIENLPGSAFLTLSNAAAYVILDPDMTEMPECPADLVAECQASGWDNATCPCLAQNFAFSQVRVESLDAAASDVTVDIPSGGFWAGYSMRNEGDGLTPNGGDAPGELCESTVDASVGEVLLFPGTNPSQTPWLNQGAINYPGDQATSGAGYSVQMRSSECSNVFGTEDPNDFAGSGEGANQESGERGNLQICAGCLRATSCDELIPGI